MKTLTLKQTDIANTFATECKGLDKASAIKNIKIIFGSTASDFNIAATYKAVNKNLF